MRAQPPGATVRVARRVSADEAGLSLAEILGAALASATGADVSRTRVRAMIAAAAVRVDGRPIRIAARRLRVGQRIDAVARLDALRSRTRTTDRPFRLGPESILYRDRWILAVSKPSGLPTHATVDEQRPSLVYHVERALGGAPVAVHQRLDRDTSGVVVFGIDPAANAGLARAFADREAEKTYLALTKASDRRPPRSFSVDAPLAADGPPARPVRVGGERARPARTDVRIREVLAGALMVEALPRTGRKHQVRVHLAHVGLPVLGDAAYGAAGGAPRLMLHAARISLAHPVTGRRLIIDCPLPADFAALLERLRHSLRR
jgi:23S rRNA pseudouridine1911/1915/1917 synthase